MRIVQEWQKKYADHRHTDLEYVVGWHVWLKVSPMRGVCIFGVRGKLSLRYIGSFEILDRVGEVYLRPE